jgi:hypothetical protein
MFGTATPYLMSVSMMLFSGASALVLMAFIRSLDGPEPRQDQSITKHAA